jgi:SAM-dependent methyltransferase
VGALPVYGVQLLLVLAICIPLRLDAPIAYVAAHFSNPITLPLVLAVEIEIGSLLLTGDHATFSWEAAKDVGTGGFVLQLALGAPILGLALAALGGALALLVARGRQSPDPLTAATERTAHRFGGAPTGTRFYVRGKLDGDPVLGALAALPGSFGRLTDAGCGHGQVGLCLHELGKAETLFGFDPDPGAIEVASAAAGADAELVVGSFESFDDWPPADTVLMIDSLHYVDAATQDAALRRAAASLAPEGRLVIREVNRPGRFRSWRARWLERLALFFGIRRATRMQFRSPDELVASLERLGLETQVLENDALDPFDNVMIVGSKRA